MGRFLRDIVFDLLLELEEGANPTHIYKNTKYSYEAIQGILSTLKREGFVKVRHNSANKLVRVYYLTSCGLEVLNWLKRIKSIEIKGSEIRDGKALQKS